MSCLIKCLFYILLTCCTLSCGAAITVIYPADEIPGDTRYADLKEILRTALDNPDQPKETPLDDASLWYVPGS